MATRLGALTPVELYSRRLDSKGLGWTLFAVFTLYTLPYMVTGVQGIGVTLDAQTGGAISARAGAAAVMFSR